MTSINVLFTMSDQKREFVKNVVTDVKTQLVISSTTIYIYILGENPGIWRVSRPIDYPHTVCASFSRTLTMGVFVDVK